MAKAIETITRGSWTATIYEYNIPQRTSGTRYCVAIGLTDGCLTRWPIRHCDGTISYDCEPSRDARRVTVAAFGFIDNLNESE